MRQFFRDVVPIGIGRLQDVFRPLYEQWKSFLRIFVSSCPCEVQELFLFQRFAGQAVSAPEIAVVVQIAEELQIGCDSAKGGCHDACAVKGSHAHNRDEDEAGTLQLSPPLVPCLQLHAFLAEPCNLAVYTVMEIGVFFHFHQTFCCPSGRLFYFLYFLGVKRSLAMLRTSSMLFLRLMRRRSRSLSVSFWPS